KHVEVFQMSGVGTFILGRPRPLPGHQRAANGQHPATPSFAKSPIAWGCHQRLRGIYHQRTAAAGMKIAEDLIATLHACPIPEVARLGRTLRAWRTQVLAYFDTDGVSNGGTEAINLIIEKTRRLTHGFRTFTHYRLRILLGASGDRPWRPNHA
ncbi:transposase, partial [Cellulomonas sp. APG4]|uniref:transposase n=1 Tax=Cellulomonas sp. APG4 TaxID=1538656 RepID=UPI00137B2FF4